MCLQREYLYNSIQDTVSTIRAIDTKLHIILAIYLLPLAMSDKPGSAILHWHKTQNWNNLCLIQTLTIIFAVTALLLWMTGLIFSLRGIIAISNPANAIKGQRPRGTFYYVGALKGVFRFRLDSNLQDYMSGLPQDEAGIVKELAFEQMKLG